MSEPPPRARWVAIDALRALAVLQMVQGHTVDALLATEVRQGPLFAMWLWLRGLTAPAFLMAAGMSLGLVRSRAEGAPADTPGPRLRRAAQLLAIGFALHAADDWSLLDILHCTALSLVLVEVLRRTLHHRAAPASLALATLAVAVTPWAWDHATSAWAFVWAPVSGSLFPLLPWPSYLLLAYGLTPWLLERPTHRAWRLAGTGGALLGLAMVLTRLDGGTSSGAPSVVLTRIGVVLVVLACLDPVRVLPPLLAWVARHSLGFYVAHLLILYSAGMGLVHAVGPSLSGSGAILTAALVFALSGLAVHVLDAARQRLRAARR